MNDRLTPEQAAARIGVCVKTLRQLRKQGVIRYIAVTGRKVYYRPEDCDAFLESRVTVDIPSQPTQRRSTKKRLRGQGNVVSFTARRQERIAARGR